MSKAAPLAKAVVGVLLVSALAACKVNEATPPELTGPSELALSINLSAIPDVLTQDGVSQSRVIVQARNAQGQPVADLPVRLEISIYGVFADFGQLSARNVVTSSDGRASLLYTAPPRPADSVDTGTVVTIMATPAGTDYANALARQVEIRLVPPGVILPPNQKPIPAFTFSQPTEEGTAIDFDASRSQDPDGAIAAYAWDFGDGSTGAGQQISHTYRRGGSFTVTLTVTDNRGASVSVANVLSVQPAGAPTASFTVSPTSPNVDETVFVNASGSEPATGRTIVRYEWTFGDGGEDSGVTSSHRYRDPGSYVITLTVEDDLGKKGTASRSLSVGTSRVPTAAFAYSPISPAVGESVFFNAAASQPAPGRTIAAYNWTFGDGSGASGLTPSHRYGAAGLYVVTLTVRDDAGQTSAVSQSLTVGGVAQPTANFTISPSPAYVNKDVVFDATSSTVPAGRTIVRYEWNYGDTTQVFAEYSPTSAYRYTARGTYTVTLTIFDNTGQKATTSKTIEVQDSP